MGPNIALLKHVIATLAAIATIIAALIGKGETVMIYIIISFIVGILIGAAIYMQRISIRALIPIIIILIAAIFAGFLMNQGGPDYPVVPTINDLTPDKMSPQISGASIKWNVDAISNDKSPIYYKFSLIGPATGEDLLEKTDWQTSNSWTWHTSELDAGVNTINVKASSSNMNGNYSSKDIDYTIAWANITKPEEGEIVNGFPRIEGKSKGISSGIWVTKSSDRRPSNQGPQLWIFVYPHASNYYPQDLDVNIEANGDWSTNAGIDGESGQDFDLMAVLADANATKEINRCFEEHNESLPELPLSTGCQIVDKKTVKLIK